MDYLSTHPPLSIETKKFTKKSMYTCACTYVELFLQRMKIKVKGIPGIENPELIAVRGLKFHKEGKETEEDEDGELNEETMTNKREDKASENKRHDEDFHETIHGHSFHQSLSFSVL